MKMNKDENKFQTEYNDDDDDLESNNKFDKITSPHQRGSKKWCYCSMGCVIMGTILFLVLTFVDLSGVSFPIQSSSTTTAAGGGVVEGGMGGSFDDVVVVVGDGSSSSSGGGDEEKSKEDVDEGEKVKEDESVGEEEDDEEIEKETESVENENSKEEAGDENEDVNEIDDTDNNVGEPIDESSPPANGSLEEDESNYTVEEPIDKLANGTLETFNNGTNVDEEDDSGTVTEEVVHVSLSDGKMFEVLSTLPHDKLSFTQGLSLGPNNTLYESIGLYRKSKLRKLDRTTGNVIQSIKMADTYFAEGMTYHPPTNQLYQITWKAQTGFVYDADTLEVKRTFHYKTTKNEGWGITYDWDRDQLVVSDGSEYLHFWDANTLEESRDKVKVMRQDGRAAVKMNELEYWKGKILANVWYEDVLLLIDPLTGECEREYDFSHLWPKRSRPNDPMYRPDCLNGITITEDEDVLIVTGKLWDKLYEIRLLEPSVDQS